MGFDRVFAPTTDLDEVAGELRKDILERSGKN